MAISTSVRVLDLVELIQNKRIQIMKFISIALASVLSLSLMAGCGGGSSGPPADVFKTTCLPTLAAFNQLYSGMPYSQVVAIIGCEGSLANDTTNAGVRTQKYEWGDRNAQQPDMVKLFVTFKNGLVVISVDDRPVGFGLK
jgi:hypothetical protein